MKQENRKPTGRELQSIATPGLVRRVIRPKPLKPERSRTDEEILGEIHEQNVSMHHEDEDDYLRGERILRTFREHNEE